VDTLTPWDGPLLTQSQSRTLAPTFINCNYCFNYCAELGEAGVKPEEVTYVVCTHGHSGCNGLFLNISYASLCPATAAPAPRFIIKRVHGVVRYNKISLQESRVRVYESVSETKPGL
jgi:glyoxylase-like metal-dependent hydrolase (beta-lactamase superfamily II)